MAGRSSGRMARSSGAAQKRSKSEAKAPARQKSKKRAAHRSQNAFNLAADASAEEDDLDNASDGVVKPEDDEEIDSDEAFESGDDEKFGSFKFSGSSKKGTRKRTAREKEPRQKANSRREIDLNEDSESDDESRAVPSARQQHAADASSAGKPKKSAHFESEDESEQSASDFEDDAGDDLMDLSEMLGSSKKPHSADQASESTDDHGRAHSTGVFDEIPYKTAQDTIADDIESEQSEGEDTHSSISSDDSDLVSESSATSDRFTSMNEDEAEPQDFTKFVSDLDEKRKRTLDSEIAQSTRPKRVRIEADEINERKSESEYNLAPSSTGTKLRYEDMLGSLGTASTAKSNLSKKATTLNAPLAKPMQDRMDRAAAYDTVKDQITKWQPAVKQLREAAVLKFPLNEPAKVQPNNNSLASTFKPTTDLETEIDGILKTSGMQSEKQVSAFEDLEMAKLSVEEVQKRRAELAIMRDLMFRQERKAKRQNKIKSKAYRKVHRKEREKLEAAIREAEGEGEDVSRKDEERRARERMELRHKNTGKWAQKMISRADHSEGSRAAITEQLQRGEALERKIRGLKTASNDSESSDSDDQESGAARGTLEEEPLPHKGVFSMKFMRDADARAAQEIKDRDDYEEDEKLNNEEEGQTSGRRVFTPAIATQELKKVTPSAVKRKRSAALARNETTSEDVSQANLSVNQAAQDEDLNPWLTSSAPTNMKRSLAVSKNTDDSLKFADKLKKAKTATQLKHQGNMNGPKLNMRQMLPIKTQSDNGAPDEENEDVSMVYAQGRPALQQADLVAKAFAGDDVVAEFEAIKEAVQQEDAPQEIDQTLPGWGSWTGDGVKQRKNARKFTKHVEGIQAEKRKDAKLKHVIINEKRMKQAKPYMSQTVPFPFENKEQYERSLALPLGPEWTTRTAFQKQITPHVIKKQGHVIAPMQKPFRN